MNKSASVKVPVTVSDLEAAAINISVLADGLTAAFENSCGTMQALDNQAKSDWFHDYWDALNGGLSVIGQLSRIICDGLSEVSASRITE